MSDAKNKPIPIRLTAEMLEKVAEASRLTGLAQADVMRLALGIGLEDLRKVGFDLARLVSDAAQEKRGSPRYPALKPLETAKVAEDEAPYGKDKAGGKGM